MTDFNSNIYPLNFPAGIKVPGNNTPLVHVDQIQGTVRAVPTISEVSTIITGNHRSPGTIVKDTSTGYYHVFTATNVDHFDTGSNWSRIAIIEDGDITPSDGLSAFEVWQLQSGNDGLDEAAFIEAITGSPGETGETGETGGTGAIGPTGLTGQPGQGIQNITYSDGYVTMSLSSGASNIFGPITGSEGTPGSNGTGVALQGSKPLPEILSTVNPLPGDLWISATTGTDEVDSAVAIGDGVAFGANGLWSGVGQIQGPPGALGNNGLAGLAGTQWFSGAGAPSDSNGDVNDFYYDTTNDTIHKKGASTWSELTNLTVLGWTDATYDPTTGNITFTHADSTLSRTFGPITGSAGLDGAPGATGDAGTAGATGDAGRGISTTTYNATTGNLSFDMSDNTTENIGVIKGADGATGPNIVTAGFIDNDIVFTLNDVNSTTVILTDAKAQLRGDKGNTGATFASAIFDAGDILFTLNDAGNTPIRLADATTILQGPPGEDGSGVDIIDTLTVEQINVLSTGGLTAGDMYIASNGGTVTEAGSTVAGDGITWTGAAWSNVGPIRGPIGLDGPSGPQGPAGATGPGGAQGATGASVVNTYFKNNDIVFTLSDNTLLPLHNALTVLTGSTTHASGPFTASVISASHQISAGDITASDSLRVDGDILANSSIVGDQNTSAIKDFDYIRANKYGGNFIGEKSQLYFSSGALHNAVMTQISGSAIGITEFNPHGVQLTSGNLIFVEPDNAYISASNYDIRLNARNIDLLHLGYLQDARFHYAVSASGFKTHGDISSSGDVTASNISLDGIPNVSASLAAALAGGDDLGNHTAVMKLNLNNNEIYGVTSLTASGNISTSGALIGDGIVANGLSQVMHGAIFIDEFNTHTSRLGSIIANNGNTAANYTQIKFPQEQLIEIINGEVVSQPKKTGIEFKVDGTSFLTMTKPYTALDPTGLSLEEMVAHQYHPPIITVGAPISASAGIEATEITASGNISASGNIIASEITGSIHTSSILNFDTEVSRSISASGFGSGGGGGEGVFATTGSEKDTTSHLNISGSLDIHTSSNAIVIYDAATGVFDSKTILSLAGNSIYDGESLTDVDGINLQWNTELSKDWFTFKGGIPRLGINVSNPKSMIHLSASAGNLPQIRLDSGSTSMYFGIDSNNKSYISASNLDISGSLTVTGSLNFPEGTSFILAGTGNTELLAGTDTMVIKHGGTSIGKQLHISSSLHIEGEEVQIRNRVIVPEIVIPDIVDSVVYNNSLYSSNSELYWRGKRLLTTPFDNLTPSTGFYSPNEMNIYTTDINSRIVIATPQLDLRAPIRSSRGQSLQIDSPIGMPIYESVTAVQAIPTGSLRGGEILGMQIPAGTTSTAWIELLTLEDQGLANRPLTLEVPGPVYGYSVSTTLGNRWDEQTYGPNNEYMTVYFEKDGPVGVGWVGPGYLIPQIGSVIRIDSEQLLVNSVTRFNSTSTYWVMECTRGYNNTGNILTGNQPSFAQGGQPWYITVTLTTDALGDCEVYVWNVANLRWKKLQYDTTQIEGNKF